MTVLAALVVPTVWLAYRRLAGVTYIQVETGARYCDTQAGDTDDQRHSNAGKPYKLPIEGTNLAMDPTMARVDFESRGSETANAVPELRFY